MAQRSLIGSADTCLPVVERVAEIGVDEIACLVDFGIGTDAVLESLRSLAKLKDRCADL